MNTTMIRRPDFLEGTKNKRTALSNQSSSLRKKGDSNPRYPYEYDSLANCWFQPLTHPSLVYALTFCAAKIIAISEFANYIEKNIT